MTQKKKSGVTHTKENFAQNICQIHHIFRKKNSEISIFRQKYSIFLLELYPNLADFFIQIITNVAKSQN